MGFPLRLCHIKRDWEEPHNLQQLQQQGRIKPSKLTLGKQVDDYVMINDPKIRKILHSLVYGAQGRKPACKYSIDIEEGKVLEKWIKTNQKCLLPYIPLVTKTVNGKQRMFLDEKAKGILPVSVFVCI